MQLTNKSKYAWEKFIENEKNQGHVNRLIQGDNILSHVRACWKSALSTAQRVKDELPDFKPKTILEVGSSTGLNCYALQRVYPNAVVVGIEPEIQALKAAEAMVLEESIKQPKFMYGVGENLPLQSNSIDLIICHTVIEHVNNVDLVIQEMSRVLSGKGFIHLEAPNYMFPYEPHLCIITIPCLGKKFVKLSAILQGRKKDVEFINHLKFVTPSELRCKFKKHDLYWYDRSEKKINDAAAGKAMIRKYKVYASILRLFNKLGLSKMVARFIFLVSLYPSVLYTLYKQEDV